MWVFQVEGAGEELYSSLEKTNQPVDDATLTASRTPNISNERREQMERAFETKAYWSDKESAYYDSVSVYKAYSVLST